jgi:uncharacterized membrane protein
LFDFSFFVSVGPGGINLKTVREAIAALGVMCSIGVVADFYSRLPATIATHFNAAGVANGFGGKYTLWVLVGVGAWTYGLLSVINFLPVSVNLGGRQLAPAQEKEVWRAALALVGWVKAEMAWIVAYLLFAMSRIGLGRQVGLGAAFLPVLLVVVGGTTAFYTAKIFGLMREKGIDQG